MSYLMKTNRILALIAPLAFSAGNSNAQTTSSLPPAATDQWRLNEAAGASSAVNTLRPLAGTHRNGAVAGTAGVNSATTALGVAYDGVDDGTELPPLNYTGNSASFLMWVRRDGAQSPWAQFFYSRGGDTDAGLGVGGSHELRYHWEGTKWQFNPTPALTVPDGQWSLAALVVEPTQASLYLRTATGLQKAVNVAPHGGQSFDGTTWLGRDATRSNRCFRGSLDEVQFFQRALTEGDIQTIYSLGQAEGLTGTYFTASTFTGTAFERMDPSVNFCWGGPGQNGRPEGVTGNLFSVRWTGYIIPKYTQTYTFQIEAGGSAEMRVNGNTIISGIPAPGATLSGTVSLTANQPAEIRIDYAHIVAAMPSHCALFWLSPSQPLSIVPQSRLRVNAGALPAGGGPIIVSAVNEAASDTVPILLRTALEDLPDAAKSMRWEHGPGTAMDLYWDILASRNAYYTLECSETMGPWLVVPRNAWSITSGAAGREYCHFRHWVPASGRNYFRLIAHPRRP